MLFTEDDVFYVCSLIEFVSRITNNHRADIIVKLGEDGIKHQLDAASVNHCLSFEQVADELIEQYGITKGNFDTISNCKYKIPTETSIGRIYQGLVSSCKNKDTVRSLIDVFCSFISDKISEFSTGLYYCNPDYLRCSYEAGELLD